ncbi:hypothetical protein BZZ01_05070 [Nostocales cyanobacterium HT-58-2]|nr:hypothetical protein BZZ01_05070 [Nostocales cyanobacterium HT-58-2]
MAVAQQANFSQRSFVQLDDSVVEILISDQLTKTDRRLFWYLFKLERWGDHFVDLPSQSEIALELGVRRETINQSQAKLQSLGLFDFKITGWKAKNLVAPKSHLKTEKDHRVLEKSNTELKESHNVLEKTNTELEESHNDIYIDRARDQTLQTNTDLIQTLSDCAEKEKKNHSHFEEVEETNPHLLATLDNDSESLQLTSTPIVKANIPACGHDPFYDKRVDSKDIQWNWLPSGPWKTEQGKLDFNFHTAIAQKWIKEHGGDLHEKRANVLKHFKKDPANIPIEWEWYQNTVLHKAANIQTRKLAGIDTTFEEQEILKHQRAAARLPQEMRVSEGLPPEQVLEQIAPHTLGVIQSQSNLQQIELPKDDDALDCADSEVALGVGASNKKRSDQQ